MTNMSFMEMARRRAVDSPRWRNLLQTKRCCWCRCRVEDGDGFHARHDDKTIEHIVPRSQGGAVLGLHNLEIACHFCNALRNDMPAENFRPAAEMVIKPNRNRMQEIPDLLHGAGFVELAARARGAVVSFALRPERRTDGVKFRPEKRQVEVVTLRKRLTKE